MTEDTTPPAVLILEDDLDLSRQWVAAFDNAGFLVEAAASVTEALAYCRKRTFDAVVADLFIASPRGGSDERSGYGLITYLRSPVLASAGKWTQTVPILAISGAAGNRAGSANAVAFARTMGATVTRQKPISPKDLVEAVREMLRAGERSD